MYSSNDRYFAAQLATERREMMMQRSSAYSSRSQQAQPVTAVATFPRAFGMSTVPSSISLFASLILPALIISLLASLIILAILVLIPLGL